MVVRRGVGGNGSEESCMVVRRGGAVSRIGRNWGDAGASSKLSWESGSCDGCSSREADSVVSAWRGWWHDGDGCGGWEGCPRGN